MPSTVHRKAAPTRVEILQTIGRQKSLLARVHSGELKVKDGGAKILAKLQQLEEALEGVREREGEVEGERAGESMEERDGLTSKELEASNLTTSTQDGPLFPYHGKEKRPISPGKRRVLELRELAEKTTIREEDVSPLIPKPGGFYREVNGKLQPVTDRIPVEAVIMAETKAKLQIADEINKSADRLASVLRIKEDSPLRIERKKAEALAVTSGDVERESGKNEDGPSGRREREGEEKRRLDSSQRTVKVISIAEAAEWERKNNLRMKAYEDKIAARQFANVSGTDNSFTFWKSRDVVSLGESSDEVEELDEEEDENDYDSE